MPAIKGMDRLAAMTKHHWGTWPMIVIMGGATAFVGYGVYHNIIADSMYNWKAGSKERAKKYNWEDNVATNGTGVDTKVFRAPQEYRDRIGGGHDYDKQNFPRERPNIEKMWADHKAKNPDE